MRPNGCMITTFASLFVSVLTAVGAPPTHGGIEQAKDVAEAAALEDSLKKADAPISFYGKIVDQSGNPVGDAGVVLDITHYDPHAELRRAVKRVLVETNKTGSFSVENEKGAELFIATVRKNGYEFVFSENHNRGFDYQRSHTDRHIPNKNNPVLFHLRKRGLTTFLLEGQDLPATVAVRPDGNSVVAEVSKDPNYYWPDDRKQCLGFPGFTVSASLLKDTRDWVLTFKGKHEDDSVLLLDHSVYEGPEKGYTPSAELKISLQKNPVPGRGPTYPHEINSCLVVITAKPNTFSRINLQIFPRQEEKCDINYKIIVNPYGDKGFEYASEIDKYWDVKEFLRKQAVHALCNGKLPPKPDIPQLIQEAKANATKKNVKE